MRAKRLIAVAAMALLSGATFAQAAPASTAVTGKATYFQGSDIQNIWKDLEAKQGLNRRVLEGGSYSINVRIVKASDPPLQHAASLDIWLVMEGSATAVTGGQLADLKKRTDSDDASGTAITGGVEQPLKPGDVLYIPPGVPHGFKDIKGFRAFLIRMDSK